MAKTFALIGVAGYIAERHLAAIKETGNSLVAAMDISDSVGVIDSYFPQASFFTEFERFERHLEKLRREETPVDYLVVCTPNYLHDSHIRCGIRVGANVICEKPVVVKPHNLTAILEHAKHWNRKIYCTMQLRKHPLCENIKEHIEKWHNVKAEYVTPRGNWYDYSWKGSESKSGGIVYNIGIHILDLLVCLFGKSVGNHEVSMPNPHTVTGKLYLEKARVDIVLSTIGKARRIIRVEENGYDLSGDFEDLHTKCYKSILAGSDMLEASTVIQSIRLADEIRSIINDT